MAVFLYTAPLFSALGLHFLLPQERLSPVQWLGMLIAFGGVVLAISGMAVENGGAERLKGDLYGLLAGIAWGASTLVIRTTRLAECPAKQTLLCQLTGACVLLSLPALATKPAFHPEPGGLVQPAVPDRGGVVFSYLIWFSLLRRYQASSLGILTFMTPVFGILAGSVILGEPLQIEFVLGAVLIVLGLIVVSCSYLIYFDRRVAQKYKLWMLMYRTTK